MSDTNQDPWLRGIPRQSGNCDFEGMRHGGCFPSKQTTGVTSTLESNGTRQTRKDSLGHMNIHHGADVAVGQNQWYHFGVGAPPILVYFVRDWDVHWGHGILTHDHVSFIQENS